MNAFKLGIFGGTFDPPHIGHVSAASAAVTALGLDKLIVIPDAVPPHKQLSVDSADAATRFALTQMAMSCIDNAVVSDIELRRAGTSYTVDTLMEIRSEYPEAQLYLLMGTDMLMCFETWREFRRILENATLAVFSRNSGDDGIREAAQNLEKKYGASIILIEKEIIEISSTEIRENLAGRKGTKYLDDNVYSEIIKRRLYGAKPDFEWLREKAYAMLDPKRIQHVAGCEQEACRLAERWGADTELAREAAILHDITKKENLKKQLELCEKYSVDIDDIERTDRKLLHSKTGAAVAKYEFGCDDSVFNAIFWHTTGKPDMTILEKVIYLADYIEPSRDFDGVEKLRSLAYENIDAALELGFQMSIEDLQQRNILPHPMTLYALKWVKQYFEGTI